MSRRGLRPVLVFGFAAALAGGAVTRIAQGTVLVPTSIEDAANGADIVAVGSVVSTTGRWLDGRIVTDATVQLDRAMRGSRTAGEVLTVETPGGTVGDTGQRVAGAPSLQAGGRYVLFLRGGPGGVYFVSSWSVGALPVRAVRDASGTVHDRVYASDSTGPTPVVAPGHSGGTTTPSRGTWRIPEGGATVDEVIAHVQP